MENNSKFKCGCLAKADKRVKDVHPEAELSLDRMIIPSTGEIFFDLTGLEFTYRAKKKYNRHKTICKGHIEYEFCPFCGVKAVG